MQIVEYNGRIEVIPLREIAELRGFLKGINTEFERISQQPKHSMPPYGHGIPILKISPK
jgi:hypothetical protein